MSDSYEQTIQFLMGRINFELFRGSSYTAADFKLERMREFLRRLGDPQLAVPAVHIAGTKGKGSTAAMIASGLSRSGLRTGLFTSPHISRFEERIRVDGQCIAEVDLVRLVDRLRPVLAVLDGAEPPLPPTYFEIATALGWLYFQESNCPIAVMEVGLGGRLDSTNICCPVVCVITSISLDHTHLLGNSIGEIAREKAGIIKPGVPVICGATHPEAMAVVAEVAQANDAPLYQLGRDLHWQPNGDGSAAVRTRWREYPAIQPGMRGRHQFENAALACAALDCLREAGHAIDADTVAAAILQTTCAARFEIFGDAPAVVVDVAHNEASMQALVDTLESTFPGRPRVLIFAGSADKDTRSILSRLLPSSDTVILTRYQNNPRSIPVDQLAALALRVGARNVHTAADPAAAWELAKSLAPPEAVVVITGSFFLAAELRDMLIRERTEVRV